MLDAISEHMAQRIAQIVIANLAPVIQPQPVEDGQIVGVSALARFLECDRGERISWRWTRRFRSRVWWGSGRSGARRI